MTVTSTVVIYYTYKTKHKSSLKNVQSRMYIYLLIKKSGYGIKHKIHFQQSLKKQLKSTVIR